MKIILTGLLIFLSGVITAQYQLKGSGVLDAQFISENYFTTGILIDQGEDLGYLISQVKLDPDFVLTPEQKLFLDSVGYRHRALEIPFNYLFHEDDYWTQRMYRTVSLKDSANAHFTRGGFRNYTKKNEDQTLTRTPQYFPEDAFMNWVKEDLIKGYLTPYADIHYHLTDNDTAFLKDILEQFNQIDHLLIKEDWYYDKAAGQIKTKVIGLGFMLAGSTLENRNPLFWTYFPQMRYGATWNWVKIGVNNYRSWADVIENHYYASSEIFIDGVRNNTANFNEDPYFEDDNSYCNDLQALINVALIQEHIEHHRPKHHGEIRDTTSYGDIIVGELIHGVPEGGWGILYPNGDIKCALTYQNGIANGSYSSYYPDGIDKEHGKLSMGKKEDGWITHYPNGDFQSEKSYDHGWLDGIQFIYYNNGGSLLTYHYKDHMIDGPFLWQNEDGSVFTKGQFTKNYIDSTWEVNLPIPKIYQEIIEANPQVDWGFKPKAIKDGVLSYTVTVEQYTDPLYCNFMTCVRMLKLNFEK